MLSTVFKDLQFLLTDQLSKQASAHKYAHDSAIDKWVAAALKKMGAANRIGTVHWVYNEHLADVAARCKFISVGNWHYFAYIELSPTFFVHAPNSIRRQVIFHEVAHAVDSFMETYTQEDSHGKPWKALMKLAGVPAVLHYYINKKDL